MSRKTKIIISSILLIISVITIIILGFTLDHKAFSDVIGWVSCGLAFVWLLTNIYLVYEGAIYEGLIKFSKKSKSSEIDEKEKK